MNNVKAYFLYCLAIFVFISCSSNDDAIDDDNSGNKEEITINKSIFIDPLKARDKKSDTKIINTLIDYLDNTPEGATVHISIYLFDYQPLLNAIRKAQDRGVEIQALVDQSRGSSQDRNKNSIPYLEGILKDPSELIPVKSDVTSISINHHKIVLFSKVDLPEGIAKNVVFTTSHNFIEDGTKKVQDAIVMSHKKLYDVYLHNLETIKSFADSGMKNHDYVEETIADSLTVHFFPRRQNGVWDGEDTYIDFFDEVKEYKNAEVRVVMSDWSRVEVAEKLVELQTEDRIDVTVITKDKDGNGDSIDELQNLTDAGGDVNIVPMAQMNTHSKFVLIKGIKNGEQKEMLYTGTHNFTYNALKNNNEVLLELKNTSFFKDYWSYYDRLLKDLIFK